MGDKSGDGVFKNRIALGDVSNQLGKRRFVSISSGSSGNGVAKKFENDGGNVLFPVKVESLGKGKCVFEFGGKGGSSVLKPKDFGPAILQNPRGRFGGETKEISTPRDLTIGVSDDCDMSLEDGTDSDEETGSDMSRNLGDAEAELTSDKSTPISGSQEAESEKCVFSNFDASANSTMGIDFLKTCSCSFCLKAAYIWTDLQYQDTKGRIAALKRSRKDVRSVIEKSCTYGGFGKNAQAVTTKPTKLEHDLMGQWRSLFLHTEDVLIRESSQLQTSLLNLKELRDSCKADLNTSTVTTSNG